MKKLKVQYNFTEDPLDSKKDFYYQFETDTGISFGIEKTIQLKAVNETMTAKKITSLVSNMEKYSNKYVSLECGPEAKALKERDIFRLFTIYPTTYSDYKIKSISKNYSGKFDIEGRLYADEIYDDLTLTDPTVVSESTSTVNGPATISGTYTNADATEDPVELTVQEISGYDIYGFYNAAIADANYELLDMSPARPFYLPIGLTGSSVRAKIAATATTVFTLKKNAVDIGTITFAAGGTVATFSFLTKTSFVETDTLSIVGPASPDSSLSHLRWTIVGIKESTFG